jgi:hypothetical protein
VRIHSRPEWVEAWNKEIEPMAKKATKASSSGGTKTPKKSKTSASAGKSGGRAVATRSAGSQSRSSDTDVVDALIKLLQSPLVIDLLAVGATAALAAITETRSSRTQGAAGSSKKTLKAAGKAAAAAVGRRLQNEFEEITAASKRGSGEKARAGAKA